MECATCGGDLAPDARFCVRCGARVELGSVLGVGTDLPPAPAGTRHASVPGPPSDRSTTPTPEPTATRALPWTRGDDLGSPEQVVDDGPRGAGDFPPGRIAALVGTFVVLTVIGTFVLTQLFGSGPAATTASDGAPSPTGANVAPGSTTPSPDSTPAPGPSTPGSPEQSPTASAGLPAGARRCSRSGDDAVASAYSGNRDTSCAFTNAVRTAYRGAGTPTGPFRVYSTVTKRWYDVSCAGGPILRCADGAAVVFLGP